VVQRRDSRLLETISARTETLPDNVYRIPRLSPGAYDIFVQVASPPAPGVTTRVITHAGKYPVNIANDNVDLGTVDLRPTVNVRGRVTAAEQLPAGVDPKKLVITLRPLEMPANFGATARGTTPPGGIEDDGSFVISNIPPGRFQIVISGLPPDTYLVSARSQSREVLDTGVTVSGDEAPLDLVLGGPGSVGELEGAVVNARGEAVAYSVVALIPNGERRTNPAAFKTATTDQHGMFTMRSVMPGDYKVFAWEEVEPGAYLNADFLKDFEARGEPVRVQKGAKITVGPRAIQ
jgi:hypothetical protein